MGRGGIKVENVIQVHTVDHITNRLTYLERHVYQPDIFTHFLDPL